MRNSVTVCADAGEGGSRSGEGGTTTIAAATATTATTSFLSFIFSLNQGTATASFLLPPSSTKSQLRREKTGRPKRVQVIFPGPSLCFNFVAKSISARLVLQMEK